MKKIYKICLGLVIVVSFAFLYFTSQAPAHIQDSGVDTGQLTAKQIDDAYMPLVLNVLFIDSAVLILFIDSIMIQAKPEDNLKVQK